VAELDPWQIEVMNTPGNIVVRAGRQVGKSFIISRKAGEYAIKNPKKTVMIVASVERQACLLFEKVLNFLYENYRGFIRTGTHRPTKHKIELTNGSVIHSLPTGLSGYGIRGYTIDLLICDECAFIPDEVFTAIVPMIAVTKGTIWALSTPHGRDGYFFRCFSDESFTKFHVSSLDCPRRDDKFLERERARMSKLQFTQEYLGEFIDELKQFFPSELIKKCMILQETSKLPQNSEGLLPGVTLTLPGDMFLGVDIARLGADDTVLLSVAKRNDKIKMADMEIIREALTTETTKRILLADKKHKFRKIFIDDGGIGGGVMDQLIQESQTRYKTIALNNASKSIDGESKQKRRLFKEDLYSNLLAAMERGKVELWDNDDLYLSLKSIQYEYSNDDTKGRDGRIKIFGNYSHIAEALVRATWCLSEKGLNLWCEYKKDGLYS
jgi:hypothetical protein